MITELIQWIVTNLWGPPTIELTGPWTESLLGGPPIIRLVEMVGPWSMWVCTKLGELPII